MNIGFSVILNTTNEADVQKLAQLMQVFADQTSTVQSILVSKAVRWDADSAVTQTTRPATLSPAMVAPYGAAANDD